MALTLVTAAEAIMGANNPKGYPDTKNRQGQELETLMLVEHTEDTGVHSGRSSAIVIEIGTFVGDGTGWQTVSLSNSSLWPYYFEVWADHTDTPEFFVPGTRGDWVSGSAALSYTVLKGIMPEKPGSYTNSTTYNYFVMGYDIETTFTGDTGAGSDPSWIGHDVALLGGNASQTANSVEDSIYTAFTHEHTAAGVHNPAIFSYRFEWFWYLGDGTDSRVVSLVNDDLDVKWVFLVPWASESPLIRSEDMTGDNTKRNGVAAFAANYIEEVGTGYLTVGSAANANGTYYYYFIVGV